MQPDLQLPGALHSLQAAGLASPGLTVLVTHFPASQIMPGPQGVPSSAGPAR